MPKIVIDARESGTSTGRYIDKLIEYLCKLGVSHKVVVLTKKKRLDYIKSIAPKFEAHTTRFKEFTFGEQLGLLKQIRSLKPDLVFFPAVQQPILYRGTVVTTMQDLTTTRYKNPAKNSVVFWIKQSVYKVVNRLVAKKSKAIITYTNFVKDDVARYTRINSRKITAIYLGADKITDKPEPVEGLENRDFIMYIGRPLPHKNLRRLIDAFALIRQSHPELRLVLAGKKDSLYKRHEKYASKKGIKNIIFTGFVSEGQLRWLYENTKAYVFPSLSEGFGLPGLEAMVHGAPVVSSNATCLPEVYKDGAHYFSPESTEDMATKIAEVIDDKKLSQQLVAKGHSVAASYSWERMAKQTLEVFEQALKY